MKKHLSSIDAWAIAFGCMVGWGAFVMPGTTFLPVAGVLGTVIAMAISVVIILIIGANFAYLMKRSPESGGVYSYTKEAFGRDHAFLCAWFLCLSYLTIVFLNGTALFVVIRTIFGDLLQSGYHYTIAGNEIYLGEVAVSAFALAVVGLMFIKTKTVLRRLLTVLAFVLLIGAALTAAMCLPRIVSSGAITSFGTQHLNKAYAIFTIVILAPWAFVGFDVVSFETDNFKFPPKNIKRIIFTSILVAAFVYTAMTFVSVAAIPDGYASWMEYIADLPNLGGVRSVPTFYAARTVMGTGGLAVIGITALAAILTGIIGAYRAATRVLATMAEDKILSEKFRNTTYSILFIMIISILLAFLGRNTLNWFVDLTSFGAIIGFGYTSAASYKTAKIEGNRAVMATGIAGTVISVAFGTVQLVPRLAALEAMSSAAFLLLSLWCLLGFVFYWRTVTNSTLSEYSGMSASGVILFALLLYTALMWFATLLGAKDSISDVRAALGHEGFILIAILFIGLVVMVYIQNLVRKKHEESEREKIRAVESSIAKSQFLFNMSHDIRTPMNAIIGYTNLAKKESNSPVINDYLAKIDISSKQLLSLINDILEMSRIENGRLEIEPVPTDLRVVFNEARDIFAEQMAGKGIDFTVSTGQIKNPCVWCDKKNLNRVLLNIISNAYKFTPSGGSVTVSVWETSGENDSATYEIRVQDSGIGMSKEFAEKMFSAFERERTSTDSGIEGTGLGLAITKSIVDLMDGTIDVITSPGSGTEMIIRIRLPFADAADVETEKGAEEINSDGAVDFTDKRLLIVEDNAVNMEIANMILSQAGFKTDKAENGKAALEKVMEEKAGYYDAILMDIQMPVMDGYTAAREIRALADKEKAAVPIIAITANAFHEDEVAAKEAGMQAHIAKPFDVEVMMKTLTEVLSHAENIKISE